MNRRIAVTDATRPGTVTQPAWPEVIVGLASPM